MLFLEADCKSLRKGQGRAGGASVGGTVCVPATWRRRCGQFALAFKNKTATVNNDNVAETGNVDGNSNNICNGDCKCSFLLSISLSLSLSRSIYLFLLLSILIQLFLLPATQNTATRGKFSLRKPWQFDTTAAATTGHMWQVAAATAVAAAAVVVSVSASVSLHFPY